MSLSRKGIEMVPEPIETLCRMMGIDPPRLLTREDIQRMYPKMPKVQEAVWKNVEAQQK
jgi:hypothetical protein